MSCVIIQLMVYGFDSYKNKAKVLELNLSRMTNAYFFALIYSSGLLLCLFSRVCQHHRREDALLDIHCFKLRDHRNRNCR
jgi:hypothetical protein